MDRGCLAIAGCWLLVAGLWGGAARAEYPAKAITLIVPFSTGGPTDVVARIVGEGMSRLLRQPIIVENIIGTAGTIAAIRTKRAIPDGYTMMMGHLGTHAAAVALFPNLPYDPSADFEPVGMTASMAIVLLARRDFPADDLQHFAVYLREHSARLTMGHAGTGSVSFSACRLLNDIIGAEPKMTPFQGTGPALVALAAGDLDYMCDQVATSVRLVNGGAIKAYAIASVERSPALPRVPTSTEAGVAAFQVTAWNGLFAPKGTPPAIVRALNDALVATLADPDTRKRLQDLGAVVPTPEEQTPQALAALAHSEIARWKSLIDDAHAAP
jgi:tripartite-type tricarboxylate transporter receptor subunit TctC